MIQDAPRRRNTLRAEGFDYSTPGNYFVTVVTNRLSQVFGEVTDGQVALNTFGEITSETWQTLPSRFDAVGLDVFVIMPNHVHGIITLLETSEEELVRARFIAPRLDSTHVGNSKRSNHPQQGAMNRARTSSVDLGEVVRAFKAVAARRIRNAGLTDFKWHRNYYDHIIRDERDLDRVRTYIANNPANWPFDKANRKDHP